MDNASLVEEILQEVLCRLKDKCCTEKILIIGEKHHLKHCEGLAFHDAKQGDFTDYNKILITQLSLKSLSGLALGYPSCETDEIILKALLQNKKVYLLEEGLAYKMYKKSHYNVLYAHYMQCEDKLRKYGIQLIQSPQELLKEAKESQQETINLTHLNVLRESDIIRVQPKSIIETKKKCLITPLAKDCIHDHGLIIKRI